MPFVLVVVALSLSLFNGGVERVSANHHTVSADLRSTPIPGMGDMPATDAPPPGDPTTVTPTEVMTTNAATTESATNATTTESPTNATTTESPTNATTTESQTNATTTESPTNATTTESSTNASRPATVNTTRTKICSGVLTCPGDSYCSDDRTECVCDDNLPDDYRCALVVVNRVEKEKVNYRNQCELDAAKKNNDNDTYKIFRFYFEKCVYEGDFWDGSRTFPLVIGIYTGLLMLLAFGILISRGGSTGEYAVKNQESSTTIKNQAYQGTK